MGLSKKGVESFPFFLFLTLLIAASVIAIGFYQINVFSEFSSKRKLTNNYNNLISSMENLRATSDQGSFTKTQLYVPKNYNLTISSNDNTIKIFGPGIELNNSPKFNILNITDKYGYIKSNITLQEGEYTLVVYYGAQNNETEPFEVFFT